MAVEDESIDFSDIPELDEKFWRRAELFEPDRTEQVTIRVKRSVLAYFKAPGKGYQTRMNQVLENTSERAGRPGSARSLRQIQVEYPQAPGMAC